MNTPADGAGRWSLANLLTGFRLAVASPAMLVCGFCGWRGAFIAVLLLSFFSDAVDGLVARWTGRVSRFGAMLDSWADVVAYTAIAISVTLLWPGLVRRELFAFGAIVGSFLVPSAVGLLKFGHFTAYHTRLVKLAVATVAAGLFVLLLFEHAGLFRIAAAIATLAALEEVAISLVLDAPRTNVRGLRQVLKDRA
ncbi:MAG: CDP-alcohol phosphatidyltransferase family protein [Gammaproteobacteria bacterium]